MGLFGRDDRPNQSPALTPSAGATRPQPRAGSTRGEGTTVIAPPSRVEGHLSSDCDVHIEGELKGTVKGDSRLFVAETGKVEATLHGRVVVVAGTVKGDVLADEKIELQPSANLHGNITAPRILIQEGATFEGQVFMQKPGDTGTEASRSKPQSTPGKGSATSDTEPHRKKQG